jgi:dephospho-CoA kinase
MAKLIGITGGIGSGKSIVCKFFALLGVPIYEADKEAKKIMTEDLLLKEQIEKTFGKEAYFENGELNRRFLAQNVFNNSQKVTTLNSLVHPRVAQNFLDWTKKYTHFPYILNEAALMFESGSYQRFEKVITVFAPLEIRKKRILERDKQRTMTEIDSIIQKQLPEEEKLKRANFVIINDDKTLLIPQILKLHEELQN